MTSALFALNVINQIMTLVPMAIETYNTIRTQRDSVERMIVEKRDPTAAEWASMSEMISGLIAQLDAPR